MKRHYVKAFVSFFILLLTAGAFIYYFQHHPQIYTELKKTNSPTVGLLLFLYFLFTGSIALILRATLRICNASIGRGESILITIYSAIINFFGPLQSGPAFRALYLKKKHGVRLKSYGAASLLYYAVYGLLNVILLFSGVTPWWALLLAVIVIGATIWIMRKQAPERFKELRLAGLGYLVAATCLQIFLVTLIFLLELRSIDPSVTIMQAASYAGAANLALFVSITPGAIGFRESFLYLSQQLHGIATPTIVAANVLDRSMYITVLLLIAVYLFGTSARRNLLKAIAK